MKRTLSLLLVLGLLLSMPIVPVFAETTTVQEENITPLSDECPCGCGEKLEDVDWQPLASTIKGSIPEGHHYLTEDINQGDYGLSIIAGTKVVLDLRGFTWTNKFTNHRILTVQGDMWMMDTVGGGKLAPKIKSIYGGAILIDAYEVANPSFTLVSGTITSGDGSGLPAGAGVVYAWEDSSFIMTGGVVENIHARDYGGAIMASGTASIQILGGMIRDCSAGIRGGAIYSASTTEVVLKDTTFINNTVNVNTKENNGGGAVYSANSKLIVENCTFMGNTCPTNGGGALHAAAGLEMKDSLFIGNSAVTGGDIYLRNKGDFTIDNCKFYGGYSTLNGGSVYVAAVTATMEDSLIQGAIADKQGGSIYQSGGNLTLKNCELSGGIANWSGSVYCGGGNLFTLSSAVTTITDSTIRNGFAKVYGGNIALAGTTLTLNNSTVTGGVAKYHGNNIGAQAASTLTINGGTIDGDIYIPAGKPITLKGAAKIGLRNNGLATGADANIDASGLTEGAEIYISGTGNLVAAGANMDYFKGAIRTSLSAGAEGQIVGTAGETGYCPHCLKLVDWEVLQDLSEAESLTGHYYASENFSGNSDFTFNAVDVVIDLNGKTISDTSGRAFTTRVTNGACTLSLLDSAGNSLVKSYGPGKTSNGGVIYNNGSVKIYGGNFINTAKDYAGFGGLIYNGGTLHIYGGFFDGSNYENTTSDKGMGGLIYVPEGKTTVITAGHFVGGKAYNAGCLYVGAKTNTTISGGTFVDGTATNGGGNIYFADGTTGSCQVSDIVIRGGTATNCGGNIRLGKYPTVNTFDRCYIGDGTATASGAYGGNVLITASNATVSDSVIYGGTSAANGGNVYAAGTGGAATLDSCLIIGGTAKANGGNIMFNHGNHTIKGGEISYGTARVGGNMYAHAGNHASGGSTTIQKNAKGEATQIFGGRAKLMLSSHNAAYGGNLSIVGTMNLTDAVIYGGEATTGGHDIQIAKASATALDPKVTVGDGVVASRTGTISVLASVDEPIFGQIVKYTVCNGLNAKANMILEGVEGDPSILANGGTLVVAGAQLVDEKGDATWVVNYESAEALADENSYVKLYADADLTVTRDTFVDLNGNTVTVSGSGKLLGMDATGDGYDLPKGKITFEGAAPVANKSMVYAPNGNKYVALVEDGNVTFHRLGADLTSVTINIDKNAVYFKGKFGADEKLKGLIDTYGIAVSLSGMPDETLNGAQKSTFQGADMENGETASGVYVTNILKEGLRSDQNNNRGQMKIYATAYVTLDGKTLVSDQSDKTEDDIAWSLQDAFQRLDQLIDENPTVFRRYTNDMRAYYAKWKDKGIESWVGENTNFIEPEEDDVIDVLMIGSSSCYYYVEEMAALAEAAGIKLRVCNVYYSGCPIGKYYEDWKTNYADYQFFDTTAETLPDGTIKATRKAAGGGKTLEWCLAQGDWDIISMQSTGRLVMRDYLKGVDHLEASDVKEATEVLFPYIQDQFPDAKMYIREQSSYQVGKVLSISGISSPYKFEDLEDQQIYAYAQKDTSLRMVEKFNAAPYNMNIRVMPACQAMMLVREGFEKADGSGVWESYDQLCARVGFRPTSPDVSFNENDPHEGDHGHVGDIGGGQYVEAALWLQVIMQDYYDADFDVRDIDWVPTYYQSGEVVENRFDAQFMREAAYLAATEGWNYTPTAN